MSSSSNSISSHLQYHIEPKSDGEHTNGWALFFWHPPSAFNNWTLIKFKDKEGIEYDCIEQYMMAQKALLFQDKETYSKIMITIDGKQLKDLGRKVKGFEDSIWDEKCDQIVENGLYFKFSQNEPYKQKLLATGHLMLVEASPFDKRWGIGVDAKKAMKYKGPEQFKGENRLGKALMRVREQLNKESENVNEK